MSRKLTIAAAACALLAACANGQPGEEPPVRGKITLAEWDQSARRRFDMLDKNHDGRIDRAELPKTPAEKMAERTKPQADPKRRP